MYQGSSYNKLSVQCCQAKSILLHVLKIALLALAMTSSIRDLERSLNDSL